MAEKKIGVYGDSIAFGYGNSDRSWFDLLASSGEFKHYEFCKSARNGEEISDIFPKLKQNSAHFEILFLSAGINDLLFEEKAPVHVDISELLNIWDKVLIRASQISSHVIVTSVLPVREDLFPGQLWLDAPMWVMNDDIIRFNQKLSAICQSYKHNFFDLYSHFAAQDLSALYADAVHLNSAGQNLFFSFVRKQLLADT